MTVLKISEKGWNIIVIIEGIIFIVFFLAATNAGGFMTLIGRGDSDSTLYVLELNGSAAPQGSVVSLTAEDFQVYTKLAPIFRDKTQKPDAILEGGTHFYRIPLTVEERGKYHLFMNNFLECEGKYYSTNIYYN